MFQVYLSASKYFFLDFFFFSIKHSICKKSVCFPWKMSRFRYKQIIKIRIHLSCKCFHVTMHTGVWALGTYYFLWSIFLRESQSARICCGFQIPHSIMKYQVAMMHGRSPTVINTSCRQKGRSEGPSLHLCLCTTADKLYKSCSLQL